MQPVSAVPPSPRYAGGTLLPRRAVVPRGTPFIPLVPTEVFVPRQQLIYRSNYVIHAHNTPSTARKTSNAPWNALQSQRGQGRGKNAAPGASGALSARREFPALRLCVAGALLGPPQK